MISPDKERLTITLTKGTIAHLNGLHKAFVENGVNCTKSEILEKAFTEYLLTILTIGNAEAKNENKEEEIKC